MQEVAKLSCAELDGRTAEVATLEASYHSSHTPVQ